MLYSLSLRWPCQHSFPVYHFQTCVFSQPINLKKCHFSFQTLFSFDVFWNGMVLFLPWDCGLAWAHRSEIRLHYSLNAKPLIFRPKALEWLWEMEHLLEGLCIDDAYWIYSADMGSKPLSVLMLLLTLYCLSFSSSFVSPFVISAPQETTDAANTTNSAYVIGNLDVFMATHGWSSFFIYNQIFVLRFLTIFA